jgi:hypothetical protein
MSLSKFLYMADNCEIGDEGCKYLSRGQWPKLKKLEFCTFDFILDQNNITLSGIKFLGKFVASPDLRIKWSNYETN